MNTYETLLDEAYKKGLIVKEKPLESSDGRIKGNKIAIRQTLTTSTEKACVLAEELGHYNTGVGNILDQSDSWKRKQERQARLNGYDQLIGLCRLVGAYEAGCHNRYDIAEYLDVTDEYLQDCIHCYREKYGTKVTVGEYLVVFIPNLLIYKKI